MPELLLVLGLQDQVLLSPAHCGRVPEDSLWELAPPPGHVLAHPSWHWQGKEPVHCAMGWCFTSYQFLLRSLEFSPSSYAGPCGFGELQLELTLSLCPFPQIPLLRRALVMSKRPLLLFGSPWTAPAWMKSNGDVRGKGTLKGKAGDKYHKTWANYFIKYCLWNQAGMDSGRIGEWGQGGQHS